MVAVPQKEILIGIIGSDEDSNGFIQTIIENRGLKTATVSFRNIEEGFDRYKAFISQYRPHMLVIDIPYLEDWEIVKRMTESSNAPILLITCDPNWQKKFVSDFNRVKLLTKPFDIDHFEHLINDSLSG
ncbi:hypothetical protein HYU94_04155 [Candidatus Daviesbacteria bacterium]|nr:hypothetical protein [Candidatus Daviesbacteria bacterium]